MLITYFYKHLQDIIYRLYIINLINMFILHLFSQNLG